MRDRLHGRLLWREFGTSSRHSTIRGLYGDRAWISDLDIVNELGGHSGCVNALSWSTSGRLLASGSDDQHLNIHTYQPESSTSPFQLNTTVATGHGQNIFSVKFMPHSSDRTLVTAAGDAEVRVFDIEHSGRNAEASTVNGQRFQNTYRGVRYLSDGNTNARVYRSHADRVKRIVTESSPHLFLTCSEDGEVRQFDLRMPSSAYPAPRGGRGFLAFREDHDNSNVPPPLITYKRYNLDLNTISCSASQPYYIALGGAHLHCFLHDRRMLGRDMGAERGQPSRASLSSDMSSEEEESMSKATKCVRRFAPDGKSKAGRQENRHITACKISDANPNEMIVSWSGDHIYSFDLVKDASAQWPSETNSLARGKQLETKDRKRKRKKGASSASLENARSSSRQQPARSHSREGQKAIRATYANGETEDIMMSDVTPTLSTATLESARDAVLTESQKRSLQIAKSSVKIRKLIFSLEASPHHARGSLDPTLHRPSFTSALGFTASCFPEMKQISGSWRYPVDPLEEDVILQQTLRGNRDSSQRFVQAAGTLARSLGGKLQTASQSPSPALNLFESVLPLQPDGPPLSRREMFSYTFLKAILLWLDGGTEALLKGFKRPPDQRKNAQSFPIPDDANESAIHDLLIPEILRLASESPVMNVDASRFERDEKRKIFDSETAAVIAFSNATRMPLHDLSKAIMPASEGSQDSNFPAAQDKKAALNYWGFKVGRSLLIKAGEEVDFQFVDVAFGGLGTAAVEEDKPRDEIDPEEEDPVVEKATIITKSNPSDPAHNARTSQDRDLSIVPGHENGARPAGSSLEPNEDAVLMSDLGGGAGNQRNAASENSDNDDDTESEDDDDDENDDSAPLSEQPFIFQSAFERSRDREKVERDVPCFSQNRTYQGHCNIKTVKDANFYGLHDQYVVSGSDGGHVFIWDKATSELVNILEGDGEVVNVIQGHPYEPLLAVSGIDHTIKIFSPDARAQDDAKKGINISNSTHTSQGYSSLSHYGRRRPRNSNPPPDTENESRPSEGLESRKRMQQSYQIISQNDARRQGGMRDAYITRGMLAHVAARLRARRAQAAGEGEADGGAGGGIGSLVVGEDGETIVVDDNCSVM